MRENRVYGFRERERERFNVRSLERGRDWGLGA